jgi:hypothetical protein
MEAFDKRATLGAVGQELRSPLHGHAADVPIVGPGFGHHAHARVAPHVADLLGPRDTDHGQCRRIVEEPHRHRQRGTVALDGGQYDDVLRGEESLDASLRKAHRVSPPCHWVSRLIHDRMAKPEGGLSTGSVHRQAASCASPRPCCSPVRRLDR